MLLNKVLSLKGGYSHDEIRIRGDEKDTLATTRTYTDLTWAAYKLPKLSLHIDKEERDYLNQEDQETDRYQLRSDYSVPIGPLTLQHNFSWTKKKM